MTDTSQTPQNGGRELNNLVHVEVTLSREEVLVILNLIGTRALPRLGEEPIPGLTDEQRAFALIVAERALRARGLATINEEGKLLIHSDILRMVGFCALSTHSIFVTAVESVSGIGSQLVAHLYEAGWVLHLRPDPVLHTFELGEKIESLVERIAIFAGWTSVPHRDKFAITVAKPILARVREMADSNPRSAIKLLVSEGNDPHTSQQLVDLLAQPHIVTVTQRVHTISDTSVSIQSITILHLENNLLVAVETQQGSVDDQGSILVQTITNDDLKSLVEAFIKNEISRVEA